ncbi:MAG: hypothetical protein IPM27_10700 [Nitrosomonadales bacterium]|nr:hypothetical protein [Nitrosomonadales bacterium]
MGLEANAPIHSATESGKRICVQTFGGLSMQIDGRCSEVHQWRSRKLSQLFSFLVACGGRNVPTRQIIDLLWPDAEGDKAEQNLEFNLRQLRKQLTDRLVAKVSGAQLILWHQGKVSFNEQYFTLDIWQWDQLCQTAETLHEQGLPQQAFHIEKHACRLMQGSFMEGEEDLAMQRDIWQQRGSNWLARTEARWRENEKIDHVSRKFLNEIALRFDPNSERLCMQAMLALLEEGYSADALRLYFSWLHRVKAQYGIKPGQKLLELVASVQLERAANEDGECRAVEMWLRR